MNYDLDYYENLLRQYSATGEQIARRRWQWITDTIDPKIVLDYGSGVGWFRAWRPKGVEVHSYDIGPFPQTGVELRMYDVVCFWDVLEHIDNFSQVEPILALSHNVAGTVPIKPDKTRYATWKHFKIGEHLHFWNKETLNGFFERYGFQLSKHSREIECPPRKDILSFFYQKEITR